MADAHIPKRPELLDWCLWWLWHLVHRYPPSRLSDLEKSMTTSVLQAMTTASCPKSLVRNCQTFSFLCGSFYHTSFHSTILTATFGGVCDYLPNEETKVGKGEANYPRLHNTQVAELGSEPLIRLQCAHSSHNPMEILPRELAAWHFSLSYCRLPAPLSSQFVPVQCLSNVRVHTNHLGLLLNCRGLLWRSAVGPEIQVLRWCRCCWVADHTWRSKILADTRPFQITHWIMNRTSFQSSVPSLLSVSS